MASEHALKISELTRSFGRKRAVDGVDLSVSRGEILGFLGPNGAGKTTLMNLVMGLLAPDGGEIELLGVKGGARTREVRLRVGYLQEKPRVYPEMSARAYLDLFARLYGVPDRAARVADVLARGGLSHAADRALGTYSRGMQQRACLARVMLHQPEFLLLDEPTLGLDPTGVAEMRDVLLDMRAAGTTLFFSSHQLAEMERICDRVAFMKDGRLVAAGTLAEMLPEGQENVLTVDIAETISDRLDTLQGLPGCQSVRKTGPHTAELVMEPAAIEDERAARASISRALTERGLTVLAVGTASPSLEDIFLALDRSGTTTMH
jgi:ABC-type multidrug transport system ATPase subunit